MIQRLGRGFGRYLALKGVYFGSKIKIRMYVVENNSIHMYHSQYSQITLNDNTCICII